MSTQLIVYPQTYQGIHNVSYSNYYPELITNGQIFTALMQQQYKMFLHLEGVLLYTQFSKSMLRLDFLQQVHGIGLKQAEYEVSLQLQ